MKPLKPTIIPRQDHPISRALLSKNAVRVLYRLKDQGFIAYLVGGCVRDLLLGREPKDFDIATNATPGQIKRLFRNCRLVGRRFRLAHLYFDDEVIEVATFRSGQPEEIDEGELPDAQETGEAGEARRNRAPLHLKSEEGVLLRDNVFGDPAEDAVRRDFTVNALCYNIVDFSIMDYVEGIRDLKAGVIRTIGEPALRFTEDPVRMIRAVRFAAMLGFNMEEETWKALLALSHTINRAAPARLYDEVLKLFLMGEAGRTCQLLRRTGLFAALFPHFNDWLAMETDGFPHSSLTLALDFMDKRFREGVKIPPELFLALMFGPYLEEKAQGCAIEGAPPMQALSMAIADFMAELTPTVRITQKTAMQVREILSSQHRFEKKPGKRPQAFISRRSFAEALEHLSFQGETEAQKKALCDWWKRYLEANPPTPQGEEKAGQEQQAAPKGGRRRRRRRCLKAKV